MKLLECNVVKILFFLVRCGMILLDLKGRRDIGFESREERFLEEVEFNISLEEWEG